MAVRPRRRTDARRGTHLKRAKSIRRSYRHPLRPQGRRLPLHHMPRSNRQLLVTSPEPRPFISRRPKEIVLCAVRPRRRRGGEQLCSQGGSSLFDTRDVCRQYPSRPQEQPRPTRIASRKVRHPHAPWPLPLCPSHFWLLRYRRSTSRRRIELQQEQPQPSVLRPLQHADLSLVEVTAPNVAAIEFEP